jgi:F0F1-type ATP synthase assembly protein I
MTEDEVLAYGESSCHINYSVLISILISTVLVLYVLNWLYYNHTAPYGIILFEISIIIIVTTSIVVEILQKPSSYDGNACEIHEENKKIIYANREQRRIE